MRRPASVFVLLLVLCCGSAASATTPKGCIGLEQPVGEWEAEGAAWGQVLGALWRTQHSHDPCGRAGRVLIAFSSCLGFAGRHICGWYLGVAAITARVYCTGLVFESVSGSKLAHLGIVLGGHVAAAARLTIGDAYRLHCAEVKAAFRASNVSIDVRDPLRGERHLFFFPECTLLAVVTNYIAGVGPPPRYRPLSLCVTHFHALSSLSMLNPGTTATSVATSSRS